MHRLIIVRHGESTWNKANLFTGWTDVPLSPHGEGEAAAAGKLLLSEGILPDVAHTSVLTRAIDTLNLMLAEMDRRWIPVRKSWRLNERHYGALQGLDKKETSARHGADQVHIWRRSYDTPPPPLRPEDERHPRHDPRYADLPPDLLPATECLRDVVERMLPYWYDDIVPDLETGRTVLVSAHGNSLRALVKHLEDIADTDIPALNIPTGVPRLYDLDESFRPQRADYLGDPEEIAAAAAAVARQSG